MVISFYDLLDETINAHYYYFILYGGLNEKFVFVLIGINSSI